MRRVQIILERARSITENVEFTENTGIQDEELIQNLNDAQVECQSAISREHPNLFQHEKLIDIVAGQEAYPIPPDCFLGTKVDMVEFSASGDTNDYSPLRQGRLPERTSGTAYISPLFYIRRSTDVLVQPSPGTNRGKLRLTYQKALPKLDKRRGRVASVTLGANTITSLILDTTQEIQESALEEELYITVANSDGVIQMKGIKITDVDANTGTVTIDSSFVFEDGETISVGDYVFRGKESTDVSQLPEVCERYLIQFEVWKMLKRDSSQDSAEADQEIKDLLASIVGCFAEPDGDVQTIPLLDTQYMNNDWIY